MARATLPPAPWWLDGGPDGEGCPHCLAVYAYEVDVRCAACDRPSCTHCTVVVHGAVEILCPECAAAEPAGDGGGGGEEDA